MKIITNFSILVLLLTLTACTSPPAAPQNDVPQPTSTMSQSDAAPQTGEAKGDTAPAEEVITTFSTPLKDKMDSRIHNIKLSCDVITNTILQPGEEFSFNGTVGERTAEKGYQEAYILVGKKKKMGIGGGICQVSTTLYNVALDAGLDVTERHEHEKKVPYVDKGKDATVSYGTQDLKFKNTKDFPVKIMITVVDNNSVEAKLLKVTG